VAVGAVAWTLVPGDARGFAASGVRVGVLMILAAGVFGASLGQPGRRRLILELLAVGLTGFWGLAWTGEFGASVVIWGFLLLPWCWVLPLRGVGWCGLGRLVYLTVAAALLGTPWLVPPAWNELPGWSLAWNPLIRLHGVVLGEDWLHGPVLYPRVGERFYLYPEGFSGLAPLLGAAGAAILVALVGTRLSRGKAEPGAEAS